MRVPKRLALIGIGVFLFAAFTGVRGQAEDYSHARIVRLSFTEGTVTVQRPDVDEWAEAPVNTPLQEGFKLQTAENSFAEVEFENSSTVRLGQLSFLEFTQLALAASGAKVNRITLDQGYATFNALPEGGDFYGVTAGDTTLTPRGKTRFRVDVEEGMLMVKVFRGSVEVMSPEGTGTLGENTVLEIAPGQEDPFQISQGITKDAWDEWVEQREDQMETVQSAGVPVPYSTNVNDLMYGVVDLAFYGNWVNLPGYGPGWIPAVGRGWSPFTAGRWCWYPSFGYTWISYEPWGWLPYHYGAWIYNPTWGWSWIPTGVGMWQPAVVDWYSGPGWVGWAPKSPLVDGTQINCPAAQGCVMTVGDDAIRNGRPIRTEDVQWTSTFQGRRIPRPDLAPERQAMLPGNPSISRAVSPIQVGSSFGRRLPTRTPGADNQPTVTSGPSTGRALTNSPAAGAVGSRRPAANEPSIVFDPDRQSYVNNPAKPPHPVSAPSSPAAARPGAATTSSSSGLFGRQPGPRENNPTTSSGTDVGTRPGPTQAPRAVPGATRSDDGESRDRSLGGFVAPRGAVTRPGDSSSGASAAPRSVPSATPRTDSGSRAGSSVGSSSRSESVGGSGGGNSGASSGPRSTGSSGSSSSGGSRGSGGWGGGSSGGGGHSGGAGGAGRPSSNFRR
ncbi:MAG: FecR domain-containing protein [Acidobacteriia bacterium]|nr:FecR domain-containing protein [Terriglobia bacterium]